MNTINEIFIALLLAQPDDFEAARKYLQWIKVRRHIYKRFYFQAHWLQRPRMYHWVGEK